MDQQSGAPLNKRQRLDGDGGDVWGDDDDETFTDEQLASIDALVSQACSQSTSSSSALNVLPQTGNSDGCGSVDLGRASAMTWISSSVVPETGSTINSTTATRPPINVVHPWNRPPVRSSMQEVEKLKLEVRRCRQETIEAQEVLKALRNTHASKELEMERAKLDMGHLRLQVQTLMSEQKQANKRCEKLQLELDFMNQEMASSKWPLSQAQSKVTPPLKHASPTNDFPPRPAKTKPPESPKICSNFPTPSSFAKKLDTLPNVCQGTDENKREWRRPPTANHVATGPGLISTMLCKQDEDLHVESVLAELLRQQSFKPENDHTLADAVQSGRNVVHPLLDMKFGLVKLLMDDDSSATNKNDELQETNCIPKELMQLKPMLGLRNDCAASLLPIVEDSLELLEPLRQVPISREPHGQDLSSAWKELRSTSTSTRSGIDGTTNSSASGFASTFEATYVEPWTSRVKAALDLLRHLCYYSPQVRDCLVTENYPMHSTSADANCHDFISNQRPCRILSKLVRFCEQSIDKENERLQRLVVVILETFTAVASYCSAEHLSRFQPMLSVTAIQNCVTLALNGTLFLQFLKLLATLFASSAMVLACCSPDGKWFLVCISRVAQRKSIFCDSMRSLTDFCLWKPLSDMWKQAANASLPHSQIDLQMIVVLSVCCTHEQSAPCFVTTKECQCSYEVVSSLVLFLERQRHMIDEARVPNNSMVDVLRKGIALLQCLAQSDANFYDHMRPVSMDFFSFLYWLARLHGRLYLGKAAKALMEMWSILPDEDGQVHSSDE